MRDHGHRLSPGQAAVVAAADEDAVVGLRIPGRPPVAAAGIRDRRLRPLERGGHEADEDVPLAVELRRSGWPPPGRNPPAAGPTMCCQCRAAVVRHRHADTRVAGRHQRVVHVGDDDVRARRADRRPPRASAARRGRSIDWHVSAPTDSSRDGTPGPLASRPSVSRICPPLAGLEPGTIQAPPPLPAGSGGVPPGGGRGRDPG